MKIDYLKIKSKFKNLDNVKVDFDEDHLMTVVVGWNGAGKSNVLEALVAIFRDLDLGESPRFAYEVKYRLGDKDKENSFWVKVSADPARGETPAKQYSIQYTNSESRDLFNKEVWHELPLSKVVRDKKGVSNYLPRYLFAYYSGPSDRLEGYFRKHRDIFYRRLLKNEVELQGEIRPLFYAKPSHSQFVLLAFFLGENTQELTFLNEHLGIEGLDAVHFVLRRPEWMSPSNKDELFWGADGVVREFLDRLYPHTLAPIKNTHIEKDSATATGIKNEFFHLFLPDLTALKQVAGNLNPDVFFKMLESMLLSEILSEVRVRVKVRNANQALGFRELSEGEQQLLTILGLLKFTGGQDSLFLLDEPDTHLNPSWTVKYIKFLKEFIPNHNTSHLLMVTHQPLAIAELQKGQVQIMWRDAKGQVHADVPDSDPRGMGYAGILTSDIFGLGSTLDEHTTNLLRKRRKLLEKKRLTNHEQAQLEDINEKLGSLSFSNEHWDNDYREYLQARKIATSDSDLFDNDTSTPDIQKARLAKATEIIRQLLKKEQTSD